MAEVPADPLRIIERFGPHLSSMTGVRLSTSALLRPLVQDALWPTAAYVGGPGELNYLAQLAPVYERFGMTAPLAVPRARFRCLDTRTRRLLGQLGLTAADLSRPERELHARLAQTAPTSNGEDPASLRSRLPYTATRRSSPVV